MNEDNFMLRAIELAGRARGRTCANPLVGAVIVRDNRIIGEGYHHYYGGDHAEVDAIKNARESVAGAEMYVNLEPCAHYGKTPPCVTALTEAGIRRIHAAMVDPSPKVSGNGIRQLREASVEVLVGECGDEARKLNEAYIKYVTTGIPFVTLKIAQTLDGRIADYQNNSKWITSEESRRRVHALRSEVDAVLIGANAARVDNPALTTHGLGEKNPLRLVLTSRGIDDTGLRLLKQNHDRRTILVTSESQPPSPAHLRSGVPTDGATSCEPENEVSVWRLPARENGRVDLVDLLQRAGREEIVTLLVEGGSEVFSAFLKQRLVDKFIIVTAPTFLGNGPAAFCDAERGIANAFKAGIDRTYQIGGDLWIEAYPE